MRAALLCICAVTLLAGCMALPIKESSGTIRKRVERSTDEEKDRLIRVIYDYAYTKRGKSIRKLKDRYLKGENRWTSQVIRTEIEATRELFCFKLFRNSWCFRVPNFPIWSGWKVSSNFFESTSKITRTPSNHDNSRIGEAEYERRNKELHSAIRHDVPAENSEGSALRQRNRL